MPAVYPQSGNIGALLRLIEQERKTAPHARMPGTEPSAPLRKSVQAPLESPIAPESPGTSRVVSMKPAVTPPVSEAVPVGPVMPTGAKLGLGGVPETGKVVAPLKYVPPEPTPAAAPAPAPGPAPAPTAPVSAPAPSLATQVKPSAYVNPYVKYFGPTLGPVIQEFVEAGVKPAPAPSPAPQQQKPVYEQKKTPSVAERLTSYLQPSVDWLRRLF